MKHVSILVPRGYTSLVNIAGAHQIFNMVNEIRLEMDKSAVFEVHLVGLEKEVPQSTGLFSACPDCSLEDVENMDLIIIPAIHDNPQKGYEQNKEFVSWIIEQYRNGAEIASMCVRLFSGRNRTAGWQTVCYPLDACECF